MTVYTAIGKRIHMEIVGLLKVTDSHVGCKSDSLETVQDMTLLLCGPLIGSHTHMTYRIVPFRWPWITFEVIYRLQVFSNAVFRTVLRHLSINCRWRANCLQELQFLVNFGHHLAKLRSIGLVALFDEEWSRCHPTLPLMLLVDNLNRLTEEHGMKMRRWKLTWCVYIS